MDLKRSLFFIFSLFLHLQASPPLLDFADLSSENNLKNSLLWNLQGKVVRIRGFWHPISPHEGILTCQPQLKSCCLKTPARIHQQILIRVLQPIFSSKRALTMEGVFKIEPSYDSDGQLVQLFVLDQAKEIYQPNLNFIFFLLILVVFLCWFFLKYKPLSRVRF